MNEDRLFEPIILGNQIHWRYKEGKLGSFGYRKSEIPTFVTFWRNLHNKGIAEVVRGIPSPELVDQFEALGKELK